MENIVIKNRFNFKELKIDRRKFCVVAMLLPFDVTSSANQITQTQSVETISNIILLDDSSRRVGKWMIKNITASESHKLVLENYDFVKELPLLTKLELQNIIADDFLQQRIVNIQNILFSQKEVVLCVLAASYKLL
jgi:hypothetical protein